MVEIRFYHLQRQNITEALPKLAERIIQSGKKALVTVADKDTAKAIDKALWDYRPESFLPHDLDTTKYPDEQCLLITTKEENINNAEILIAINSKKPNDINSYERVLYMFDGQDEQMVSTARQDWRAFQEQNYEMSYWQQKDAGGWTQKA